MDEQASEAQAEPVIRGGLAWPVWVVGLIGVLAAILYVFVVAAR